MTVISSRESRSPELARPAAGGARGPRTPGVPPCPAVRRPYSTEIQFRTPAERKRYQQGTLTYLHKVLDVIPAEVRAVCTDDLADDTDAVVVVAVHVSPRAAALAGLAVMVRARGTPSLTGPRSATEKPGGGGGGGGGSSGGGGGGGGGGGMLGSMDRCRTFSGKVSLSLSSTL